MYEVIEIIAAMSIVFFALAHLQNSQRQTDKKKTIRSDDEESFAPAQYYSEPRFIPSYLEDVYEDTERDAEGQSGSGTRSHSSL